MVYYHIIKHLIFGREMYFKSLLIGSVIVGGACYMVMS